MESAHSEALRLDAFVPAFIRERLARRGPILRPAGESFQAALLLTDLSGFSSLAESFARRGPRGAEDLKDVLNFFCGRLADLADAHGGQVYRFAGDAALALWPTGGDATAAARLAAQCAWKAHRLFEETDAPNGVRLRIRSGIGFGDIWAATVGGVEQRWELLVAGEPLGQAVKAMSAAASGDVALGPTAWAQIAPHARGRSLAPCYTRLEALTDWIAAAPEGAVPACTDESLLRAYVPRSVQARLDAQQSDWLAEFRRVSALFIRLDSIQYGAPDAIDQLQRAMVRVQTAVYRYGGSINQLVVDDKGTIVVCGWGLALHAHGDDQVRAVRAALEVRDSFKQAGVTGSFGLATGDVFTGLLGTSRRCAYTMIGDVLNVASRLMEAANTDILCDLASFEAASARVAFEALPAFTVKGREQPVDVFRPVQLSAGGPTEIIGRARERALLRDRLTSLVSTNQGGVVILEGDAGIGKSRLVSDLIQRAIAKGVHTLVATADAIERSAAYHVWCPLFDNLLGLEGLAGRGGAERRVLDLLESNPRLVPFAPFLNPVLRLNFRETADSDRVPPRGRALLTCELFIHLFRHAAGGRATLLVLEDAHWLDSSSWGLAEQLARELPEILLLLSMRPIAQQDESDELTRFRQGERTISVRLDALAPAEARALACQRLRARVLTEPLGRLILEKAEGHPLFTEELAYALRDGSLVRVDHGVCGFVDPNGADGSVHLPNTVQIVVSSRIDQLTVPEQLTVKVASVFGRVFDLAGLRATYPIDVDGAVLRNHVDSLVERDLVRPSSSAASTYLFKHAITQEVAYSLLPFALRRQLHAAAAQWYEYHHPEDLAPFYPLLAHHWSNAEVAERALFYLEKAGEQALARNANAEAIRFYGEAIAIDDKIGDVLETESPVILGRQQVFPARSARRIRWVRRLGDAAINMGRWEEGRAHFEGALTLLGYPIPQSDRAWLTGLAQQVLIQGARRLIRRPPRLPEGPAAELLHEAVCSYGRIGATSYHYRKMIQVLYALVAALNIGERIRPTSELALAFADVGNILGLAPSRRLARAYHHLAQDTSAGLNDLVTEARVLSRTAVYQLAIGNWSVTADLDKAMTLFDQVGESYAWEATASFRARAAHLTGEFELAARIGADLRARAAASSSLVHELWGRDNEIWGVLYLGQHDAALELADDGLKLVAVSAPANQQALLDLLGAKALAHLHREEFDHARPTVEKVLDLMARSPRPRYFADLYLSAAAEVCLALWERETDSTMAKEAAARVWRICRQFQLYAVINPPARARALLWRGCAEWLDHRGTRAQAAWRSALAEAERFHLPYETARVNYEIGRRLPSSDVRRNHHLMRAEEGFRDLKANGERHRVIVARRVGSTSTSM